jgi:hypothetical protein
MPQPWPIASHDSDFDSYLAGMPEASVRMFRRFVDMARTSGPVTFELQNGPIVLCGTRRIFASVRVLDNGLRGHLNLVRRVNDPRLVKVEALTKSLLYHGYLLTSISDLNAEFQRWLWVSPPPFPFRTCRNEAARGTAREKPNLIGVLEATVPSPHHRPQRQTA